MDTCTSCGARIPFSARSEELGAARCGSCGALIDLRGGAAKKAIPRRTNALVAPIPAGWKVEEGGAGIRARWGWFTPGALILIPFTAFWDGLLCVMAYGISDHFTHPARLLLGLLVPHVWVGIGLLYFILASFLNSTTVEAGIGTLSVKIGPLPWRGARKSFSAGDLTQLFVLEHRGKNSHSYEVCAVMRDGRNQSVVRGLSSADKAFFLETRLERILGIEDRPVEGELEKPRANLQTT